MKYFQVIKDLIPLLEREEEHMKQAGHLMAQSIMNAASYRLSAVDTLTLLP